MGFSFFLKWRSLFKIQVNNISSNVTYVPEDCTTVSKGVACI